MTEKEKQEQQELQNEDQESSIPPGCRFPSDPIEEEFFLSQVLGI